MFKTAPAPFMHPTRKLAADRIMDHVVGNSLAAATDRMLRPNGEARLDGSSSCIVTKDMKKSQLHPSLVAKSIKQ